MQASNTTTTTGTVLEGMTHTTPLNDTWHHTTQFGSAPRQFLGSSDELRGPGTYDLDKSTVVKKATSEERPQWFSRRRRDTRPMGGYLAMLSLHGGDRLLMAPDPGPGSFKEPASTFARASSQRGYGTAGFVSRSKRFDNLPPGGQPVKHYRHLPTRRKIPEELNGQRPKTDGTIMGSGSGANLDQTNAQKSKEEGEEDPFPSRDSHTTLASQDRVHPTVRGQQDTDMDMLKHISPRSNGSRGSNPFHVAAMEATLDVPTLGERYRRSTRDHAAAARPIFDDTRRHRQRPREVTVRSRGHEMMMHGRTRAHGGRAPLPSDIHRSRRLWEQELQRDVEDVQALNDFEPPSLCG